MNIQHLDTQLLLLINGGMANALFDILMPALSQYGYLLVIPFVLALFPWSLRTGETGKGNPLWFAAGAVLIACFAVFAGFHVESALKNAIGRARPCSSLDGIRLVISCPRSFSMPSGHAVSSFAFSAPLTHVMLHAVPRTWHLYPLVLATLIACSRIYLGVHYPTDVLAGAAIGSAIGLCLSFLFKSMVDRVVEKRKQ